MSDAAELHETVFCLALSDLKKHDFSTDEATTAVKNLKILSECLPIQTESTPTPAPEPTKLWDRVKTGSTKIWDNETTRVLIKAGGAFAGVALVTWTTVQRDHVVTREALTQANLRNS